MKVVFMSVRDGNDVCRLDSLGVHWLRENVPLLAIGGPGKPWISRDANIAGIDQQTGMRYVFGYHGFGCRSEPVSRSFAINSTAPVSFSFARKGTMAQRLARGTSARSDQQALTDGCLAP